MPSTSSPIAAFLPSAASRDLNLYLDALWSRHFADVARLNAIQIAYGASWKRRLGLIRLSADMTISFIGINALLSLPEVPEYVLVTTIAHELVHYSHGFGSPLLRRYDHPHANRAVERELECRELASYLHCCNQWIDNEWYTFYDKLRVSGWKHACEAHHPEQAPA